MPDVTPALLPLVALCGLVTGGGATTEPTYAAEQNIASVRSPAGGETRLQHDRQGRVIKLVNTRGGLRVDKASGDNDELRHDALGRITDVLHSDGTYERYRYDAAGGLIEASNPDAEVYFERDELGRVIRELTRLPNGTEPWIKSGYGPDGHRLRVQSSDGHLHHIARDEAGDVRRVELEGRRWQVDFERDALGLELRRIFPGGVASSWERDSAGRPTRRMILSGAEGILDDKRLEWEG